MTKVRAAVATGVEGAFHHMRLSQLSTTCQILSARSLSRDGGLILDQIIHYAGTCVLAHFQIADLTLLHVW